jgi:hypothetical protein
MVAVVGLMPLPFTRHAYERVTLSPSASAVEALTMRVLVVVGLAGLRLALSVGAVLPMTTLALDGVPEAVPSEGVAVTATVSPRLKYETPESVVPVVPVLTPFTAQV